MIACYCHAVRCDDDNCGPAPCRYSVTRPPRSGGRAKRQIVRHSRSLPKSSRQGDRAARSGVARSTGPAGTSAIKNLSRYRPPTSANSVVARVRRSPDRSSKPRASGFPLPQREASVLNSQTTRTDSHRTDYGASRVTLQLFANTKDFAEWGSTRGRRSEYLTVTGTEVVTGIQQSHTQVAALASSV